MGTSFLAVGQQVVILFILISIGFICTKQKFFSSDCISGIAKFVLYTVTPCVIINSFNRDFDAKMLSGLGISVLAAFGAHFLNIIIATLFMHDSDKNRECVLRFGIVFSNCGYMALPLQQALLGSDGVFYGAAFIAVFNLVNWTYGLLLMGGKEAKFSPIKLVLNPGVISVTIGLVLFLTPLALPNILLVPVQSLAALNTPLPMVIIGYYLANLTSLAVLKDIKFCLSLIFRLVALPLIALFLFYLCGLRGVILVSMVIAASAPSAANTVMFSVMFKRDAELAVSMVAVSTLFSIITMPLIVSLAMIFSA